MIARLPFDRDRLALDLRGLRIHRLEGVAASTPRSVPELVAEALDRPLAGAPLDELGRNARTVTLIVPDHTRKAALPEVLPVVLARIRRASPDAAVTVLVASGTHPAVAPDRYEELYGREAAALDVIHHDCRAADDLVTVGELAAGVPLRLHRAAVSCDLLVTVGAVKHHYFAGFGGGPKMIFPGVAGYEEIQHNHARVMRRDSPSGAFVGREAGCEPGELDHNPVAAEIARAADLRSPDLAVCLVATAAGTIAWAGGGPWREAFAAAVATVRAWHETEPGRYRLLVASGGGAPTDRSLIQCHKALDAVCRFAEDGAEVLLVAGLVEGAGAAEMLPFLSDPRPEVILERLGRRWVQYGHTTLRLVEKTRRFRVFLHSRLDPELARRLGFEPVADPADVIERWREEAAGGTMALMPDAPVYPAQRP